MNENIKPSQGKRRKRDKAKQRIYEERHKAKNPDSARLRKRKERAIKADFEKKVDICTFHLKREFISRIKIPDSVDIFSDEFAEANQRYKDQRMERMIIEEVVYE